LYGFAGQVVRTLAPHTEADPAAILLQFLAAFGNAAGPGPHCLVGPARHRLNLFVVLVGESSKARKGTSWGHNRKPSESAISLSVVCLRPMKCPHCNTAFYEDIESSRLFISEVSEGEKEIWSEEHLTCPECNKATIYLEAVSVAPTNAHHTAVPRFMAYPPHRSARPLPAEVSDPYRKDFEEAVAVLPLSPKASAALSRRNLQAIIHDQAGVKGRDLNAEIDTLIDSHKLPSHIEEGLHAVRVIGNFAAHPIKSSSSGEIVDVEEGEAEWNLDVLESLFDFYFVQPALTAKRKAEINKKLAGANKPPI
jgi:hypothetical protein